MASAMDRFALFAFSCRRCRMGWAAYVTCLDRSNHCATAGDEPARACVVLVFRLPAFLPFRLQAFWQSSFLWRAAHLGEPRGLPPRALGAGPSGAPPTLPGMVVCTHRGRAWVRVRAGVQSPI